MLDKSTISTMSLGFILLFLAIQPQQKHHLLIKKKKKKDCINEGSYEANVAVGSKDLS